MSTPTSHPGLKPQAITILDHLRNVGPITDAQARRRYGIARLGARIYELRGADYGIDRDLIKVRTRSGTARVARYSIAEN